MSLSTAIIIVASAGAGAMVALAFLAEHFVKHFGADVRGKK